MKLIAITLFALGLAACAKTKCEKYADMEIKCGNIPSKEADLTRALARGMCEAADSGDEKEMKIVGDMMKKEAECAQKTSDCSEYKKCTDAVK